METTDRAKEQLALIIEAYMTGRDLKAERRPRYRLLDRVFSHPSHLAILRALFTHRVGIPAAAVARASGLGKGTCTRALRRLAACGLVRGVPGCAEDAERDGSRANASRADWDRWEDADSRAGRQGWKSGRWRVTLNEEHPVTREGLAALFAAERRWGDLECERCGDRWWL